MPIRWRLTLWFSILLCAILILSGAVLYLLLRYYLYREIDDSLVVYSARVHGTLDPSQIPAPLDYHVLHSQLPAINDFTSPGIFIQIIDAQGTIVSKSDNLGTQELPFNQSLIQSSLKSRVVVGTAVAADGTSMRVMFSPLNLTDETLLLQVGESLSFVEATMRQALLALLIGTLLALTLTTILGTLVVRRALSPVERITGTAREIEASSDLNRRVGYLGPNDEIGRLAATFDHLIAHLHRVFDAQKRFIADASHDLRSPLTVIRGNVYILNKQISDEEKHESLAAIESEAERMSKIINDLLLLAEIDSNADKPRTVVLLKKLVFEEVQRAQRIGGNRTISIEHADDIEINGDEYRLRRMLGNLLDNAVKATSETGCISVSLLLEKQEIRLDVTDNGKGMSPDKIPHIFDRFYRGETARSGNNAGTGLGLAIVKSTAEQHGGRVSVVSEEGKGSTFTVWLKV